MDKDKYLRQKWEVMCRHNVDSISIDKIQYSINKNKRWEDNTLIALKKLKYRYIEAMNNGQNIAIPNEKINNNISDVYYISRWNPKPDMVKNMLSMSGSHCLRLTKQERSQKRRQRKNAKKQTIDLAMI